MFGFLKLQGCGLDPDDRWIYQSHFCSVCHAMKRFGGRVSSLLTNYDITFWLLLASALEQRQPTHIKLEECRNCGGIWLDDKEIDYLAQFAELPHNLLHRYPTQEWSKVNPRGHRTCPVCEDEPTMVCVPYLDVPVEMCRSCHGFWFEHGVLNRVIKAKRSPERLSKAHQQEWRCPYCENVAVAGSDTCSGCGAPRPKSGFTGKLA